MNFGLRLRSAEGFFSHLSSKKILGSSVPLTALGGCPRPQEPTAWSGKHLVNKQLSIDWERSTHWVNKMLREQRVINSA